LDVDAAKIERLKGGEGPIHEPGLEALALIDGVECKLYLARDRFGEKLLYYGYGGGAFVFASQLRALRALPGFDTTIDRTALVSSSD
jgi:asparagine synthase (glutamine-hydrolysing)